MKLGSIPEKLKLFVTPSRDVSFRWTDVEFEDTSASVAIVSPTFVTDLENLKTQKTAKAWASRKHYAYDSDKGRHVELKETYYVQECDNSPRSDVRIIDLDIRGNGGRAYRAVVDGKYLVDMREDVILDTMINLGIGKNATLPGEYVFASVNSEMKLIRVGSLLHSKMVESTEFNKKKKIDVLVPGGIYRSKTKTILYLGQFWTRDVEARAVAGSGSSYYSRYSKYIYILGEPRQVHLSIELSDGDDHSKIKKASQLKDKLKDYFRYNISSSMSKSFRECLGHVDISNVVDIIHEVIPKEGGNFYFSKSSILNVSETEGYVHPIVEQFMNEQK